MEEEAVSLGLIEKSSEDIQEALVNLKYLAEANIDKFSYVGFILKELESKQLELTRKLRQFKRFNEDFSEYQSLLKESEDSIIPIEYILKKYNEILPGTNTNELLYALE